MNLIIAYLQYRWRTLFIVRKKDTFVGRIDDCHQKVSENIGFEQQLQAFRTQAKQSNVTLKIEDFGAGSKKLGNQRRISDIYKTSVASKKYQRLLYFIAQEFQSKNILEMGTSLGFSTVYLSVACSGSVTTIEACNETHKEAMKLFDKMKLSNVTLIHSTFVDFFQNEKPSLYDLVFIDGHHDGEALLNYVKTLKPQLTSESILVIDDIRWSKGMFLAWTTLCEDPSFSSNVDLFRMGIVQFKG